MWFVCAIITLLAWGFADLFYKKGNNEKDKYSHIKTGILVGLVMGIHATLYILFTGSSATPMELVKYLPVSLCYIASMVIGYKGLKYLELSISSPIQNSSGVITSLLLCLIFRVKLAPLEMLGIIVIFIGVLSSSLLEIKYDGKNKHELLKSLSIQAVFFPIIYCIIDGLGTFLDSIYLDQMELISEDAALIAYEYTFLIYGFICYIYLRFVKNEKLIISKEKNKLVAAIFETAGQFSYVFALSSHSVISAPIVACYSAFSVVLSRLILKEKLRTSQYISLIVIFVGIIILGIVEGLG